MQKNNENVLCILGGPEFPAGTGVFKIQDNENDKTYTKCFEFMVERESITLPTLMEVARLKLLEFF